MKRRDARQQPHEHEETWRVFAAIPLPSPVHHRIAEAIAFLQRRGWRAKWVDPYNSHITVKFYGNVPVAQLPALQDALAASSQASQPFTLQVAGAGIFPSLRQPRVIWLGLIGDLAPLTVLHERVEAASVALGYQAEHRPFQPHITLARLRPDDTIPPRGIEAALHELGALPPVVLPVTTLTLYRSVLRPSGPVYTELYQFPLGGST